MKGERVLFEIAHPKHFHQFKNLVRVLGEKNDIFVIARNRDVIFDLLAAEGIDFVSYGAHGKSLVQKVGFIFKILKDYWQVVSKFNPTLIISKSSPYAAVIGKVKGVKTCIMNDSEIVALTNKFVFPLTSLMITPPTFPSTGHAKHKLTEGLFEESYLHPSSFKPDTSIRQELGLTDESYAILRFVGWHANHDIGNQGFSLENKVELAEFLAQSMPVFISSEVDLPAPLIKFKLPTSPEQIHSVLHGASLYIGDSQTMATEAALLGAYAIRFNSFVGPNDMANFKFLEEKGLLINAVSFTQVKAEVRRFLKREHTKSKNFKIDEYYADHKRIDEVIIEHLDELMKTSQ